MVIILHSVHSYVLAGWLTSTQAVEHQASETLAKAIVPERDTLSQWRASVREITTTKPGKRPWSASCELFWFLLKMWAFEPATFGLERSKSSPPPVFCFSLSQLLRLLTI